MTLAEQILSDARHREFVERHGGVRAAVAAVREAARRLNLPPLNRMTVGELDEATTCTGCVSDLVPSGGHLVRVIAGHPGCPAHGGDA